MKNKPIKLLGVIIVGIAAPILIVGFCSKILNKHIPDHIVLLQAKKDSLTHALAQQRIKDSLTGVIAQLEKQNSENGPGNSLAPPVYGTGYWPGGRNGKGDGNGNSNGNANSPSGAGNTNGYGTHSDTSAVHQPKVDSSIIKIVHSLFSGDSSVKQPDKHSHDNDKNQNPGKDSIKILKVETKEKTEGADGKPNLNEEVDFCGTLKIKTDHKDAIIIRKSASEEIASDGARLEKAEVGQIISRTKNTATVENHTDHWYKIIVTKKPNLFKAPEIIKRGWVFGAFATVSPCPKGK